MAFSYVVLDLCCVHNLYGEIYDILISGLSSRSVLHFVFPLEADSILLVNFCLEKPLSTQSNLFLIGSSFLFFAFFAYR